MLNVINNSVAQQRVKEKVDENAAANRKMQMNTTSVNSRFPGGLGVVSSDCNVSSVPAWLCHLYVAQFS